MRVKFYRSKGEKMMDAKTGRAVTLGELTPEWWI